MEYGQFCPIAKALEIIGEKWTVLIVRELLMGGSRFNELQRGLSQISPTLLTKRLTTLADYGLVVRKKLPGQQGLGYFPTEACKQLLPIIKSLGDWGMRWAQDNLNDRDMDIELLMLYLERSVRKDKLIGPQTVIHFKFTDVAENLSTWWIVATPEEVDVCCSNPGKDVDVYFTCTVRTLVDIWMGVLPYKKALREGQIKAIGDPLLTRNIFAWLEPNDFADLPPAEEI